MQVGIVINASYIASKQIIMINFKIPLERNGIKCLADVELQGISDSWTAEVKLTGHPTIPVMNVAYRLGDWLSPAFISEEEMRFFAPLLIGIQEKAETILPEE